MRQVTLTIPDDLFNSLRMTSIHSKQDIDTIIINLLKQYYNTRER